MAGKTLCCSAPGKVILFGEHAVIYGSCGIAGALNLRTNVRLCECETKNAVLLICPELHWHFKFSLEDIFELKEYAAKDPLKPQLASPEFMNKSAIILKNCSEEGKSDDRTDLGAMAFLYLCASLIPQGYLTSLEFRITSDIPIGAGVGSSAAYSVSIAGAMLKFFDIHECSECHITAGRSEGVNCPTLVVLADGWARMAEMVIHGACSGLDNFVSSHGGIVKLRNGVFAPVRTEAKLRYLVINTNIPRSTKRLVSAVRQLYDKYPIIVGQITSAIDNIGEEVFRSLVAEEQPTVEEVVSTLTPVCHGLLNSLGVGHPLLDEVVSVCNAYDLSCKLTGAGGGGCCIAPVPTPHCSRAEACAEALRERGFVVYDVIVGAEGLLLSSDPVE